MEIPEHELARSRATVDYTRIVIAVAQKWVRRAVPNAALMYGTNKQGDIVNIGIYECRVVLNHLGHIDAKKSNSPQRISELFYYSERLSNPNHIGTIKTIADTWVDALYRQIKLGTINWHEFKKEEVIRGQNL